MLSLIIAVCMAVSCAPSTALATGYGSCDSASTATIACVSQGGALRHLSPTELGADSILSSGELFAVYAEHTLYGSAQGLQPRAQVGAGKLSGLPLSLYSALMEAAAEVADGARSSSRILVTWAQLGISQTKWTREELGVDIVSGGKLDEDAVWAAVEAKTGFGPGAIASAIECLMHDCPYELYWYDKTSGCGYQIERYNYTPEYFQLASEGIEFSFAVARDYAAYGTAGGYLLNTQKTGAASRAAASAREVVAVNAGKSETSASSPTATPSAAPSSTTAPRRAAPTPAATV